MITNYLTPHIKSYTGDYLSSFLKLLIEHKLRGEYFSFQNKNPARAEHQHSAISVFSADPKSLCDPAVAGRWRPIDCETMETEQYLGLFVQETTFYNHIVLGIVLPSRLWEPLPHFLQTWLRNYIGGTLLYVVSGFLWCLYIYYLKHSVYVPKGKIFYFSCFGFDQYPNFVSNLLWWVIGLLSDQFLVWSWFRILSFVSFEGLWIHYWPPTKSYAFY